MYHFMHNKKMKIKGEQIMVLRPLILGVSWLRVSGNLIWSKHVGWIFLLYGSNPTQLIHV